MKSTSTPSTLCALVVGAGMLLGSRAASAQVADGLAPQPDATEVKTEVAAEGFQAVDVDAAKETTDTTELKLSASASTQSCMARLMELYVLR